MNGEKSKAKRLKVDEIFQLNVPITGNPVKNTSLDDILREEEEELAREAKRKRLEEILIDRDLRIAEKRKKLEELKKGESFVSVKGEPALNISPELATVVAKMSDEERARFMQFLAQYNMLNRADPNLAMLYLMSQQQMRNNVANHNNPQQAGLRDLAEAVKALVEATMAVQRQPQVQPETANIVDKIVDKMTDNIIKLYNMITDERLKRLEEKTSFNPLDTTKQILDIAQQLKNLVKSEGVSPEIAVKLKELDLKNTFLSKKLEFEQQKWEKQQELEKEKWKSISEIFKGPIGNVISDLGNAAAGRINPARAQSPQPRIVQVTCPQCKSSFNVNEVLEEVTCPYCGILLRKVRRSGGQGVGVGSSHVREVKVEEHK